MIVEQVQTPITVGAINAPAPALGGSYKHLAALGNTDAIKGAAGVLIGVVINTKGATANTLTLYDSLTHGTGTVIAVIDTTSTIGALAYNLAFATGLSASIAAGTSADVTVVYQ